MKKSNRKKLKKTYKMLNEQFKKWNCDINKKEMKKILIVKK